MVYEGAYARLGDGSKDAEDAINVQRESQPALKRRENALTNAKASEAGALRSWLINLAVQRRTDLWTDEGSKKLVWEQIKRADAALDGLTDQRSVKELAVKEWWNPALLMELARCCWCSPTGMGLAKSARVAGRDKDEELDGRFHLRGGATPYDLPGGGEDEKFFVREEGLGRVVCLAGWMALDPRTGSEVAVDHVGINEGITPDLLRSVLREAEWREVGVGLSLNVRCPHPATDQTIRTMVKICEEVLGELSTETLAKPNVSAGASFRRC